MEMGTGSVAADEDAEHGTRKESKYGYRVSTVGNMLRSSEVGLQRSEVRQASCILTFNREQY
jgi:hypothetical protein